MNTTRSGAVAAHRELRGVGRLLAGAFLGSVQADSWIIIYQSIIMSKRSLFWGHGSGKLGEAVYYRAGGEQRTGYDDPTKRDFPFLHTQHSCRNADNSRVNSLS